MKRHDATLTVASLTLFGILLMSYPSMSFIQTASALSLTGTSADDVLEGTSGWDYISGEGGNDKISGLAGPDNLFGRNGNDTLDGGPGHDKLSGGKGNDQLSGGPGNDILTGGLGGDHFDCGPGSDTIVDFSKFEGDTKTDDCENVPLKHVIWYNPNEPYEFGSVQRLQDMGMTVETRTYGDMKIDNLKDADLVIIDFIGLDLQFSADEVAELKNYVNNGGRLMLTPDVHYFYCDPASGCPHDISREFGFGFAGDAQAGPVKPATGKSGHPIWNTPHRIFSFKDWCCDAYVKDILDTANVKVIGTIYGGIDSVTNADGYVIVTNPAVIVLNEDPAFNGGIVMGIGRNVFVGLGDDHRMFENVVIYMLK